MSFQFVHTEIYSRKGKSGRGTDWVFDEAARDVSLIHVENPLPPRTVDGLGINEIRQLHDRMAENARAITSAGKERKIRQDQNTLATVIASHPALVKDVQNDPKLAAEVDEWLQLNIAFLKKEYGDKYKGMIDHGDEAHVHFHAYILPDSPDMRASELHPGFIAKAEARAQLEAQGEEPEAVKKLSNAAYRDAMRAYQDRYWEQVGIPAGLTRLGPRKRRLTNEEHALEKAEVKRSAALKKENERLQKEKDAALLELQKLQRASRKLEKKNKKSESEIEKMKMDAEVFNKKGKSLGGFLNGVIQGFKGENVEETIQVRVAEEVAKIQEQADKKIDSLKGEISFQNELIHEIRAKNKKGFRVEVEISESEIEKLVQARVAEILRNPETYNTRNI